MSSNGHHRVLDVVGVGFGPSNLALAVALHEHNQRAGVPLSAEFVELKPEFGWHTGMLIPGATMQISFLKDLVTQRNPTSDFTFLNYLTERGRLTEFINYKTFFPTRLEFHDYLTWLPRRWPPPSASDRASRPSATWTDSSGSRSRGRRRGYCSPATS